MDSNELFNALLYKGVEGFLWEVIQLVGDNDERKEATVKTFTEAQQYKVNHKDSNSLLIELWHVSYLDLSFNTFIELKEKLNRYFKDAEFNHRQTLTL